MGFAFLLSALPASAQTFRPLTDGQTTKGWKLVGEGTFKMENGAFVMTHNASSSLWGHVVSDSIHNGDFTIRFSWKLVKGNSGFAFHSYVGSVSGMYGPQAELHDGSPGGLLMTYPDGSPRPWAWIEQPSSQNVKTHYKPGDWNLTTIAMKGKRVTITLNGFVSADTTDAQFPLMGHFGIQLHASDETEIHVKDLEIAQATTMSLARKPSRIDQSAKRDLHTVNGRLDDGDFRPAQPVFRN